MTPMIDVIFLLIIFFLVSSHLARQETRLPLELPEATTHAPFDPQAAPLTISVNDQAQWLIGGDVVEQAELRAALADLLRRRGRDASIRIRTDQNVQYSRVEPLLREAGRLGISDVVIAVRQPSE